MIRGTTPTHTFNTDVSLTGATAVYVTYRQGDDVIINKQRSDMTITSTSVTVSLTQAETLQLKADQDVQIQLRAKMSDGTAVASNIMSVPVEDVLKEGVI